MRHYCSSIFLLLPALDREGCARFRTLRQPARSKGPNPSLTAHAASCLWHEWDLFSPPLSRWHNALSPTDHAALPCWCCLRRVSLFSPALTRARFFIVSGADSPHDQVRVTLATPGELNVALTHTALVPVFLQRVLRAPLQNGRTGRGKGSADAAPDVGRRARG